MTNQKHTQENFKRRYRVIDDIGNVCGEVFAQNGKHIVRCVNSNDELVDNLKNAVFYYYSLEKTQTNFLK